MSVNEFIPVADKKFMQAEVEVNHSLNIFSAAVALPRIGWKRREGNDLKKKKI